MTTSKPSFQDIQYAFTAHIRDPDSVACPNDVEDRRMGIYRDLFYNNIEGFIANAFPVLKKLYTHDDWHRLVRQFFKTHNSATPYFPEIAQEFIAYLQTEHSDEKTSLPYQLELAHYEWTELALAIVEQKAHDDIDSDGDLMTGIPVLSELAWVLAYTYPVHKISPDFQPEAPGAQPTFLVVYRDDSEQVKFIEINAITANLLQMINTPENTASGEALLRQVGEQIPNIDMEAMLKFGQSTLADFKSRGIILGTKTAEPTI